MIVTDVPCSPEAGDKLLTAGETVKFTLLLDLLLTFTTTGPLRGIVAITTTMAVLLQLTGFTPFSPGHRDSVQRGRTKTLSSAEPGSLNSEVRPDQALGSSYAVRRESRVMLRSRLRGGTEDGPTRTERAPPR